MKITWTYCKTYDDAKDYQGVVYLHEWDNEPFYWGVADKSKFGGNRQKIDAGSYLNPRYGSSYKHWIEGCLRHGAKLYIGSITEDEGKAVFDVEKQLIHDFPSEMNAAEISQRILIKHEGEIPKSIANAKLYQSSV